MLVTKILSTWECENSKYYLHNHILFLKYSLYNSNIFSSAVSKFIQSMLNIVMFSGFEGLHLW